jgi:hypothetical protein
MFRESVRDQTHVVIHPKEKMDYCCQLQICVPKTSISQQFPYASKVL